MVQCMMFKFKLDSVRTLPVTERGIHGSNEGILQKEGGYLWRYARSSVARAVGFNIIFTNYLPKALTRETKVYFYAQFLLFSRV